ncbi:MAG: 7-cyano-7-deazaguanine synthase QueC [Candidatus Delongbacteria bacterium]|nr:7-cyano-7-deazaguanine synthase QueC [Candidatus Delongbacteria bacterium]
MTKAIVVRQDINVTKAIVLLSGGLDSTTCLAIAMSKFDEVHTISFDYGQKHRVELELAEFNSKKFGAKVHKVVKLDPTFFQNSSLTNTEMNVQKDSLTADVIPDTYVPARNTVFLSYALAYAESIQCSSIFIGVNSVDYSGYPDCRPEYISAYEKMANLAIKDAVEGKLRIRIEIPLIDITKSEIIKIGKSLDVDYSKTLSCYAPQNGKACGHCDSCLLRKKGFADAGLDDETQYI